MLVQRNALDLLILAFPLHETAPLLLEGDVVRVVAASCSVLLRRDMSLNRRLFNWLLGCDVAASLPGGQANKRTHVRQESISSTTSGDSSSNVSFYFEFYSKSVLVEALRIVLADSLTGPPSSDQQQQQQQQQPDLRPFRLLVSLLDKPEIGPLVIDDIIVDVFRTLYHAHRKVSGEGNKDEEEEGKKARQELIKSANLLFASFESSYIWDFCGQQFELACRAEERMNDTHEDVNRVGYDQGATVVEMCAIVDFLLDIVSIETYVETYSEHLPGLFKTVARAVAARCDALSPREVSKSLQLCKRVLSKVQPAWTIWEMQEEEEEGSKEEGDDNDSESDSSASSASTLTSPEPANEEDKATRLWSNVGKEISVDAKESKTSSSPEVGKEATESMPSSPQVTELSSVTVKGDGGGSSSRLIHQQHENLMQECVQVFQDLFVCVVGGKFLDSKTFVLQDCLSKMVQRPRNTLEERTHQLEHLLEERSEGSAPRTHRASLESAEEMDAQEDLMLGRLRLVSLPLHEEDAEELSRAVSVACQVLVELSSLPTVRKKGRDEADSAVQVCPPQHLPRWLQYLLVYACFLHPPNSVLQLNCMGTLLELISLLQSTLAASRAGGDRDYHYQHHHHPSSSSPASRMAGGGESNVAIVMMPLVKESHYHCIMGKTVVPQIMASRLWEGLGTFPPSLHLKCVTLLYQLHNLVPDARLIERILACSLGGAGGASRGGGGGGQLGKSATFSSSGVVDAYQRFTLLWHLSRDQESKRAAGRAPARTFDICLLKMLDNLNLSSGPLKALSQSWLVHAMAKGDIARLMEPLFLTLLDPSTARVSVLHAKIDQIDTVDGSRYVVL